MRVWQKDGSVYVLVVNGYDEANTLVMDLRDVSLRKIARVFGPRPHLMPGLTGPGIAIDLAPLEPAMFRLSR